MYWRSQMLVVVQGGLTAAVCFCRRAIELKLSEYLVVGPSIVTDKAGLSDSMIAELFESVRLLHTRHSTLAGFCAVMMLHAHYPHSLDDSH